LRAQKEILEAFGRAAEMEHRPAVGMMRTTMEHSGERDYYREP
jgi:hypothetical protein